ncbi:MAG TPA: hypothetical protein VEC13_02275 [Candidatus Paceibacterota bacterium]|nr:hypothetical protein [Candidatus Paceibacterota bacterium]
MTKAPSIYTHQKRFWTLSSTVFALILTYLGLVGMTVSNTLDRQRAEKEMAALQTEVSELEFAYVGLTSSITLENARTLGFVEVSEFSVARTKADNVALSR